MPIQTKSAVRKYWKPALATGAGTTSLIIWFEEVLAIAAEFISVLILLLLVGPIYLFNHVVFKTNTIEKDDQKNQGD